MKTYENEKLLFLNLFADAEKQQLQKACDFIEQKHIGQKRYSGEAYINHPLRVAKTLKKDGYDLATILAGLLHDTVEDTSATDLEITTLFGTEVAEIVNGVTAVSAIKIKNKSTIFSSKNTFLNQTDNYRKLLLAAVKDLRVIIVKLYDRLDNIQTIQYIPEHKKKFYARETIEIFAPIAERLSMYKIKTLLEDSAFFYAYPDEYKKFKHDADKLYARSEKFMESVMPSIKKQIAEEDIKIASIAGRAKGYFSLYKKIQRKGNLALIHDILALRIIVEDISDCYKTLGIIHSIYEPLPNQIDDYIAKPKNNGYRSIHTTVKNLTGDIFEVQIRTNEMHQIAEHGLASHWNYKDKRNQQSLDAKSANDWLNELEKLADISNKKEFLAGLKDRLFSNQIFVFTPKGEIIRLPAGSTPVDFAYRIHTSLGHRCAGAKINGRIMPLTTPLQNSDSAEIITSKHENPSEDWLSFVKTSEARHKIKGFIKQKFETGLIELGYKKLAKQIEKLELPAISRLKQEKILSDSRLPYKNMDKAALALAEGNLSTLKLIKTLYPFFNSTELHHTTVVGNDSKIIVQALKNIPHEFAKCCKPKITDKVIGYIGKEPIVKIHRVNCKRLANVDQRRFIEI